MIGWFRGLRRAWIDDPLREGLVLRKRYRIERWLGSGSYGLTYLCTDLSDGREVALKQARPSKGALGRTLLERETEILGRLKHPRIPACLDRFQDRSSSFAAIEYIRGQTVEDLIFAQGRRFDEPEALRFIGELMVIIGWIHGRGVVHRDLRIPNVLVNESGLHVIDFGLACRIGEAPEEKPAEEEEMRLRRKADATSDLYAIGHFMLFLLYSGYPQGASAEAGSGSTAPAPAGWQEELALTEAARSMLRRLLQLDSPYEDARAFMRALRRYPSIE